MAGDLREITHCEVCGSGTLHSALDLGPHPMCDDLVEFGSDRVCKEYPIEILFCDTCYTAHQRFQIDKHDLFPKTYHYRSRNTADVLNGMKQLVAACEETLGDLSGRHVLDIGCNDGSLLNFFAERGAKTFGIEPTGAASEARAAGHTVTADFFSEASAEQFVAEHGQVDVVTFTNVFAHIENLQDVINGLKVVCRPHSLIVIENHYLGAILDRVQFDTFYHEHPRTYSLRSFDFIARALGRQIVRAEFPERYGGNIRVFLGTPEPARYEGSVADMAEDDFGDRVSDLSRKVAIWRTRKAEQIDALVSRHGPLAGKAFPGRAAIPLKILDLGVEQLERVHEKPMSAKVGHYIPSTRIPIAADDLFDTTSSRPLLNLAWHIGPEIEVYMRQRGFLGNIIDIISADDFV